jgi:hypothetical protein
MVSNYNEVLKRMGNQLALNQKLLSTHPSLSHQFAILQTFLSHFEKLTHWSQEGPIARFSQTFELALIGYKKEESQAGFIGPSLEKLEQGLRNCIQALLKPNEKKLSALLVHFSQVMTWTMIFVFSQILGNGDRIIPLKDVGAAKSAGALLRELGITFILGAELVPSFLKEMGKQLKLADDSQQLISDVGLIYFLIHLTLTKKLLNLPDEFIYLIQTSMQPSLEKIEAWMSKNPYLAEEEEKIISLIRLLKSSIDSQDITSFEQGLKNGFENFNISHERINEEISFLIEVCEQLNKSFNNIFYQSKLTMTSMTQSA